MMLIFSEQKNLSNETYQYPRQQAISATHIPPERANEFNCSTERDGFYFATLCTPNYFACSAGRTYNLSCQAPLVFEPSTSSCQSISNCSHPIEWVLNREYLRWYHLKLNICNCRSSPKIDVIYPASNSSPYIPQQVSNYSAVPYHQQPMVTQTPSAIGGSNFSCLGKRDAIYYWNACTEDYIVCSAGNTFHQKCAHSLAFDPTIVGCQFRSACRSGRR